MIGSGPSRDVSFAHKSSIELCGPPQRRLVLLARLIRRTLPGTECPAVRIRPNIFPAGRDSDSSLNATLVEAATRGLLHIRHCRSGRGRSEFISNLDL